MIITDADGNILSKAGRRIVDDDPEALDFPWAPKSLQDKLGSTFVDSNGHPYTKDDLAGKHIGLYFGASWCGVCKVFTNKLVQTYNKLQSAGQAFEIIFISLDHYPESALECFRDMPWLTIQSADLSKSHAAITGHFEVTTIPRLIVLDTDMKVVTTEGRRMVLEDPNGANFPWTPVPFKLLDESCLPAIDTIPCLIAMTDGNEKSVAAVVQAISPIAESEFAKGEPKMRFFYTSDPEEDALEALRRASKIKVTDRLVILDMQFSKKYVPRNSSLTHDNVRAFVDAFLAGELEAVPLHAH